MDGYFTRIAVNGFGGGDNISGGGKRFAGVGGGGVSTTTITMGESCCWGHWQQLSLENIDGRLNLQFN